MPQNDKANGGEIESRLMAHTESQLVGLVRLLRTGVFSTNVLRPFQEPVFVSIVLKMHDLLQMSLARFRGHFFSAECAKESTMKGRKYQTHSRSFREEAVRQARQSQQPLSRVAAELGVNYATLRAWVKDAQETAAANAPLTEADAVSEVRRLRKEVHELRLEREILKKATAFFAKHSK
jgi:transposase